MPISMQSRRSNVLQNVLPFLAALLILKVTANVVRAYSDYLPANFESDFLRGRQGYFSGFYSWAFYTHIVSGPIALIFGLVLVSEHVRVRYSSLHRGLGKSQIAIVLLLLCPSGFWMSWYADTGAIAATGFATLAFFTAAFAILGWRSAIKGQFAKHRRWMWRCYLALCSAIVLRLMGGLATITGVGGDWGYVAAAWASWLTPLIAYELWRIVDRTIHQSDPSATAQSAPSNSTLSFPATEINARRMLAGMSSVKKDTCPSTKAAFTPPA